MGLAPLMLRMDGQPVVCVGAGPVAAGKVAPLIDAGAHVTVIAPRVDGGLGGAVEVLQRPYAAGDLDRTPRPRLVVAGTGVTAVDDAVVEEADRLGIWCLRIAGTSDVVVPAVIRRDGLLVTLSTGAPALTAHLRRTLEPLLDQRWGTASTVLAALRADPGVRAALADVAPEGRRARWAAAVRATLAATTDPAQVATVARGILEDRR